MQNGTTSFLATVIFSDHPLGSKMDSLLKILDSQVGCIDGKGAVLEGIHCEVGHNRSIKSIRLCFVNFCFNSSLFSVLYKWGKICVFSVVLLVVVIGHSNLSLNLGSLFEGKN